MFTPFRRALPIVAALSLGACSHGGPTLPPAPGFGEQFSFVAANAKEGTVAVTIVIPPKSTAPGIAPRYVSPSTASIQIVAYAKGKTTKPLVTENANLSAKASGCKASAGKVRCVVRFAVAAGHDVFDVTTFDKANQKGNQLAALQNVPKTIPAGKTTALPLTLGGLPASIDVIPPDTQAVTGSQAKGFGIIGNLAHDFTIVSEDADGNEIIGAGAPTISLTNAPKSLEVATPKPSAPTAWSFTSTFTTATDPTEPLATTLALKATPVAHSGGSPVKASIKLALYQPWLYVSDMAENSISAFDEAGDPKTLTASYPFIALSSPAYLLYAPSRKLIYVEQYSDNTFGTYDVMGDQEAAKADGGFPNMVFPGQFALVPSSSMIYVPNYGTSYGSVHSGYVTDYDLTGHQGTLSTGSSYTVFAGMQSGAWLLTYDSNNGWLYGANWNTSTIAGYTVAGVQKTKAGAFPNVYEPYGMAFDSDNDLIYVGNYTKAAGAVTAYDEAGTQQTIAGKFPGAEDPTIAYDPYNELLYVGRFSKPGTSSSWTVKVYDAQGRVKSLGTHAFEGVTQPFDVLAVP